ncbi:MAG TPA: hypothetical protein VGS27_00980 [Candidatus Sulfotelmatobacter sp.]|nr:hypothetical protein [Candidatus Sulfotelmatobacter sp.]
MGEHFHFGGGAAESTMHPVVFAATLLAALAVLFLPRRYALLPVLAVVFLTPTGQQVLIGGFHVFVIRIIVVTGLVKIAWMKVSARTLVFSHGVLWIDNLFFAWALLHAATFILLFRDTGAVTYEIAFLLDACGYVLVRHFVQDREDVLRITKTLALVAAVLALCMGYEYLTRVNVFSYINGFPIVPWVRDGRVRAQGTFSNSITAGVFGATLLPLFFWLLKGGKAKLLGIAGLAASTTVAVTSMASTGVMAYLAGILALCLWPVRSHMRKLRWGIVLTVLGLALAMKAPVWFIIARVDFIGGHGWDRAALIDAAVRHISDWWLLGTKSNASWGADTWDSCNQFVYEATSGGLATLIVFVAILTHAFRVFGKARKSVEGSRRQEWFFWCLGAALYAHVMGFWGIDYFDSVRIWWYIFLAMIPASTMALRSEVAKKRAAARLDDITVAAAPRTGREVPVFSPSSGQWYR